VSGKPTPLWLSPELERKLRQQAEASGRTLQSLIEEALRQVADQSHDVPAPTERRRSVRRRLSTPAVVHLLSHGGLTGCYRVAQLSDISAVGLGLIFEAGGQELLHEGQEFEILFQLSDHPRALRMACRVCRKVLATAGCFIGAVFSNPVQGFEERLTAFT